MIARLACLFAATSLAACGEDGSGSTIPDDAVEVRIIAFNDFHGNLEPLPAREFRLDELESRMTLAGGAAYLSSAVEQARSENANVLVISAGDLVGASPDLSARHMDEPTIAAMNLIGLDYHAVGNHEFDRGVPELMRMAQGGCDAFTDARPCRSGAFEGAEFKFLAANTMQGGQPLFPASAVHEFGDVKIGIIGVTLRATAQATEGSTASLTFTDEAEAINREARQLRQEGADAVIVVAHQGLQPLATVPINGCGTIDGPLATIMEKLEPGVDLVLSGHTHRAYICDYSSIDPERPVVITSAASRGAIYTDILLQVSPGQSAVVSRSARNVLLQRKGSDGTGTPVLPDDRYPLFDPDPEMNALIARYR